MLPGIVQASYPMQDAHWGYGLPLRAVGQPVLIGGSMGTSSYILAGAAAAEQKAFSSACHGAGRAMRRSSSGAAAPSRMTWPRTASWSAAHRYAASQKRRLEPTRMWTRWLWRPSGPGWCAASRGYDP